MKKIPIKQLFQNSTTKVRILTGLFVLVIGVFGFAYYFAVVSPSSAKAAFSGSGDGSPTDPYQIRNCGQLQSVGDESNGYHYTLMNDIDCSDTINWDGGKGFKPINGYISGTFDGRNYAIKDLYINRPTQYAVGLFTWVSNGAQIRNVKLEKSPANADRIDIFGGRSVGALVAEFRGGLIYNSHSSMDVRVNGQATDVGNISDHGTAIGGLVGINTTDIDLSSSSGDVSIAENSIEGKSTNAGGLVGYSGPNSEVTGGLTTSTISNSFATGSVVSNNVANAPTGSCGGLIGSLAVSEPNSTLSHVENSYSIGRVVCDSSVGAPNSGGFVGTISSNVGSLVGPSLENNFTTSDVTDSPNRRAFYGTYADISEDVGYLDLSSNYFDITRTGISSCGTETEMSCNGVNSGGSEPDYFSQQNIPLYSNWNQVNNWTISSPYPVHKQTIIRANPPDNLTVNRDNDNFVLNWDLPANIDGRYVDDRGYSVYIKDIGNNEDWEWLNSDAEPGSTSTTISGLAIPGKYAFKIRALTDTGNPSIDSGILNGIFTDPVEIATGMPADAPQNIQIQANAKSLELTWDVVAGATSYGLQIRNAGQTQWRDTNQTITTNAVKIGGLSTTQGYEVRVVALNIAGSGPWSEPIAGTTVTSTAYNIDNCQELQAINSDLEGIYTQTANIDCEGVAFTPIGGDDDIFNGSYNGGGFSISNVTIQTDIVSDNSMFVGVGLFGTTYRADLENITLRDSTVIGGSIINNSYDEDGNGLPDVPTDFGAIGPVLPTPDQPADGYFGVPTTVNNAGKSTLIFASSAADTLLAFGFTALDGFPRVAVGGVAGVVAAENNVFNNIKTVNTTVQGTVAGGIFGAVLPATAPSQIVNEVGGYLSQSGEVTLTDNTVTFNNLQSSGLVNGFASGGLIGVGITGLGSMFGIPNNKLIVQNSSSSSIVEGNISGGAVGIGGSFAAGSIGLGVAQGIGTRGYPVGSDFRDPITLTLSNQDFVIKKTTTSGEVNSCNAYTDMKLGSLGGIIGAGLGVSVENSKSTGNIKMCSNSDVDRIAYGGFSGGVGGLLLASRITSTTTSGNIQVDNTIEEGDVGQSAAYFGASGGLAGFMLTGADDSNGKYAILNSSSSMDTSVKGNTGLLSLSGGLTGIYLGSGTIKNSSATGDIVTATKTNTGFGAGSVSGGLMGLAVGVDVPWIVQTGTSPENNITSGVPTHGLDIDNSFATGKITSQKNVGGLMLATTGGLAGAVIGQSSITNSHATGDVTSTIPDKVDLENSGEAFNFQEQNFGNSISGGLVGATIGIDVPRIISGELVAVGIMADNQRVTGESLYIDNTYASGDVSGNITGGLIGAAELKVEVQKSYAEGNVRGQVSGGLIGQSGVLNTAVNAGGLVGLGVLGSGVFVKGGQDSLDDFHDIAGPTADYLYGGLGPVKVNNSYTTSNVTTKSYIPKLNALVSPEVLEEGDFIPIRLPTIAGGLIGLYTVPGGSVTNSYASGKVTVGDRPVDTGRNPFIKVADVPSFAGGVFGIDLAMPLLKFDEIIRYDNQSVFQSIFQPSVENPVSDAQANFFNNLQKPGSGSKGIDHILQTPNVLRNVFSASELDITDKTFTGGVSGFFVSPAAIVKAGNSFYNNNFVAPAEEANPEDPGLIRVTTEINPETFTKVDNVYMDKQKIQVSNCNYSDNFARVALETYNNSTLINPSNPADRLPPYHEVIDSTEEEVDNLVDNFVGGLVRQMIPQTACNFVNNSNTQPNYFIGNKTNAPLDEWNFSSVWKVRTDDYPKFVAGAVVVDEDDGSGTNGGGGPTPTTNTGQGSSTNVTKRVPKPGSISNPEAKQEFRQQLLQIGNITPDKDNVKGLKAVLASVPPFLAKSIPYSLIFMLLILAAMYSWQALKEYRQLNKYHKSIARIIGTKESIDNYLAITTHYLNTPVAIMSGAIELLVANSKLTKAKADIISSKIKKFAAETSDLIVANQVSNARSTNDEMIVKHNQPNPYKAGSVWIPGTIALGLIIVANALFIYADVFNDSAFRILFEIGLLILAVFLVGLAYKYRNFLESTKEISKRQLQLESELYARRAEFIPKSAAIVEEHYENLSIASSSLQKVPEAKLFFNGLNQLGEINKGLKHLKQFSKFSTDAPLFDISTYVNKAVNKFQPSIEAKKLHLDLNVSKGVVSRIQPEEITQLVESVIENAIKFSKEGGAIQIELTSRFNKILLNVSDNGIGISETKISTILQPFNRATDSMKYNYEGLGLDLFTDKIITNKLGGHIKIRSKLGTGTDVTIELPVVRSKEAIAPVLVTPTAAPAQ